MAYQGTAGNTGSASVIQTITNVAESLGVSPPLAIAIAQQESGLNPTAEGDYQLGQPTSFGLYQLHQGGELGSLTPQQAFDPVTNARVALGVLARTITANPSVTDPGEQAALAQRPSDPQGYAAAIDNRLGADNSSGASAPAPSSSNPISEALKQLNPFGQFKNPLDPAFTWLGDRASTLWLLVGGLVI
ncbi:MAG: transglycosylase SLT domain-containing protein, partial [Candidatus Dormibacteria bacterium]